METINEPLVLHSELADQLRGLQESKGFRTPEDFLQHLFSLEEQIRSHRLHFTELIAGVGQPWLENTLANQNPVSSNSIGVQVNLCCNSRVELYSISTNSHTCLFQEGAQDVERASDPKGVSEQCDSVNCERQKCLEAPVNYNNSLGQGNLRDCQTRNENLDKLRDAVDSNEESNQCDPVNREEQKCSESPVDYDNSHGQENVRDGPIKNDNLDNKLRHVIKLVNKKTPPPGLVYQCNECGKTFNARLHFMNHFETHQGDKNQQCKLCNLTFANMWSLKLHNSAKHPEQVKKTREKTRRLCHICGCELKSQLTLKCHLRTHSADKPFKCIHCPKTFKWASALEYHRRTHTGERPYQCHKCAKAFSNRSDLTRHRTVHTGEKPHKCTQCNKAFTQSHTLISHIRKCHQHVKMLSPAGSKKLLDV